MLLLPSFVTKKDKNDQSQRYDGSQQHLYSLQQVPTLNSSCRSKSKVGQKVNCQTMPTMKIGLEVISSWVCCSAPNGDLRVQISIDFYQSFANFVQIANFGDGDSMSFCIKLNVSIDVNFAKLSLSIGRCKSKDMNSHNEAMV